MPDPIPVRSWVNEHGQQTVRLDAQANVPLIGLRHTVIQPGEGAPSDAALFPYVWFVCDFPERSLDVAARIDNRCPACRQDAALRAARGEFPVDPIPPLPAWAPRFREFGDGVDGQEAPAKLWLP